MIKLLLALLAVIAGGGSLEAQDRGRYAAGQVWEYRGRPEDVGSRLKIQRVEPMPGRPEQRIYHISIIGLRPAWPGLPGTLPHLPVARETLDMSVTRPATETGGFPDLAQVDEGIAIWRQDEGGWFTASVAEIAEMVQRTIAQQAQQAQQLQQAR